MPAEAYDHVRQHMGAEHHRHKQLYDRKVEGKPFKEGEMNGLVILPSSTLWAFQKAPCMLEGTVHVY